MQNKLPIPGKVTFLGGGPMMGQTVAFDHFRLDTSFDGTLFGDKVIVDDMWKHDYRIDLASLKLWHSQEDDDELSSWTADFYYVGRRRPWVPMEPCYEQ